MINIRMARLKEVAINTDYFDILIPVLLGDGWHEAEGVQLTPFPPSPIYGPLRRLVGVTVGSELILKNLFRRLYALRGILLYISPGFQYANKK